MPNNTTPIGADALLDAVRLPLDSLHADAAYLIGRLRDESLPAAHVVAIIRERIDAAKAALASAAPPRIVLRDGAELRKVPYCQDGPEIWALFRGEVQVRYLNRFENDFVDSALTFASRGQVPAAVVEPSWSDAANWLRSNYQDYPNIASLCEGMIAASPYANAAYTSPIHWENAMPGGKYTDEGESTRVADYNRGWNDYRKEAHKKLKAITAPTTQAASAAVAGPKEAVAYLDIGEGGYLDLGSDLSDEALRKLPKGRHMLAIVGTYGVDGYVPVAAPTTQAASAPAAQGAAAK